MKAPFYELKIDLNIQPGGSGFFFGSFKNMIVESKAKIQLYVQNK